MALDLVEPRHMWVPDRVGTAGGEVTDLAALMGRPLDPEQRLAVDVLCSEGPGGRWAALEGCVIEARQNGKTAGMLIPIALAHLFLFGDELVVWSAHRFSTTIEAFRDIKNLIMGTPELDRRLARAPRESHGQEEIEVLGGGRLKFVARSKANGRGLTGDLVVMDEAFALQTGMMGALMPTLSARPNPQLLHGSSAAHADSDVLHGVVARGRAGGDPDLAYVEWSARREPCATPRCSHGIEARGCQLDNRDRWREANPAVARGRIALRTIAAERRALAADPAEFAREVLSWSEDHAAASRITVAAWEALADTASCRADGAHLVVAVDSAPGSGSTAIAVAARRADGLAHLELVEHAAGSSWAVDRVADLVARHTVTCVVVDPRSATGAMIPDLRAVLDAAGVELRETSTGDLGQACGGLQRAVTEAVSDSGPRHLGDPILSEAIAGAGARDLGDGGWAWARRRSDVDICPLVAVTLAHWGLSTVEDLSGYDPLGNIW